jgi:hypothetical protein
VILNLAKVLKLVTKKIESFYDFVREEADFDDWQF